MLKITNATVFDAKAWEWNKDLLMIMEMQVAELRRSVHATTSSLPRPARQPLQ
jgi:hypothetical protein